MCSGGQQQRAAIARVLVMSPQIIFADEPTGNLDSLNAQELMKLFMKINKENNITIIMVTHDSLVASYSTKMYYMKDGKFDTCFSLNFIFKFLSTLIIIMNTIIFIIILEQN